MYTFRSFVKVQGCYDTARNLKRYKCLRSVLNVYYCYIQPPTH